nr:hypothetical protein [Tanacetum cinerariifolium]
MTIGLNLPRKILNAQTEARKPENIKKEDVGVPLLVSSYVVVVTSLILIRIFLSLQRIMLRTIDTTIEQQVVMDEALVPSTQRSPFFKAFLVTADVPEIYMQELSTLHICLTIPGQSFDELPFEEEILDFLRFLGHNAQIRTLTDVNINKLFQP